MRLNSVWRRIIDKKNRREAFRAILPYAGQLADEMNLRLLLQQELQGEILFVEEIVIEGIHFKAEKKRRLFERIRERIKRFFGRNVK